MHQAFGVLCLNFDPIWYGHKSLESKAYLELEEFFKICEKELDLIWRISQIKYGHLFLRF